MKKYRIYQVDSFTRERLSGNPAGVVPNADGLDENQMRRIARELNNSETAFVFAPDGPDHDVHVRFFTPTMEVPICGHATIAAHYVLAKEKGLGNARVVQKTGAGLLPVDVVREGDDYSIIMTQGAFSMGEPFAPELISRIAGALGVSMDDLRPDCPVCIASTGHGKVMLGIRSNELLHSLNPDLAALRRISAEIGCNGYYVFTLNPGEEILAHGRMFSPAGGIPEDPVTGNANGPLGGYLVQLGLFQTDARSFRFKIMQGEAIGRPGSMVVSVQKENGLPALIQLTGEAVVAFSSEIEL